MLSCFECKRRKLKCGRELPVCERCISMGSPELCRYDPRYLTGTDMEVSAPACQVTSWPLSASITEENSTLPTLSNFDESLIGDHIQSSSWLPFQLNLDQDSSPTEAFDGNTIVSSHAAHMSQFSSTESTPPNGRFWGPSSPISILSAFPDLYSFMRQAVDGHHILGSPQLAAFTPDYEQPPPYYPSDGMVQAMKRHLPGEERCRRLSKLYFDHFSSLHAVFHVPTFWENYQRYWDGTHHAPDWFNAILLAILSCVRCLFVETPLSFDGASSTARNEAIEWLRVVDTWQRHKASDTPTLETFQLRCLVLLAKIINDIDGGDHYSASQALLAEAVSHGLHRDRKYFGQDESVYKRELRRKLWATVAELEIAACMKRGVVSMASSLFTDIGQPSNYDDSDYDTSTTTEPQNKPDGQLSDSSFARLAHSIRLLRCKVNNLVNGDAQCKGIDDAELASLRLVVSKALQGLPDWSSSASEARRKQAILSRAVLELYLHELLLFLHLPFSLDTDETVSPNVDTEFRRFICVRSAGSIIKIHELLVEKGLSLMGLGRFHLLRAGLALCLLEGGTLKRGRFPFSDILVHLVLTTL